MEFEEFEHDVDQLKNRHIKQKNKSISIFTWICSFDILIKYDKVIYIIHLSIIIIEQDAPVCQ
jgi:hypothetical protein